MNQRCQHEGAAGNCSDVCWWKAIIHERFLALWRQQVWQLRVWDLTSSPLLLSIGWVLHLSYLRNMMELLSWVESLEVEINIYRASSRQKKSQANWMLLTQSITAKLSLCASIEYTQQMEILLSITTCQNRSAKEAAPRKAGTSTCRQGAVNAICCTCDSLLATLEDVSEWVDWAKAVEATGLQIKSFKFLLSLIMFDRILTCTRSLSDYLQHAQVNLAKAADLVSATVSTLELFRTDEEAQENRGWPKQNAKLLVFVVIE